MTVVGRGPEFIARIRALYGADAAAEVQARSEREDRENEARQLAEEIHQAEARLAGLHARRDAQVDAHPWLKSIGRR